MNKHNDQRADALIGTVLERIKNHEIVATSRARLLLRWGLIMLVIALIALVSVFVAAFMTFAIRVSGHAALLGFGPSGLTMFLRLFPWKLAVLDAVLLVALERLLRAYTHSYVFTVARLGSWLLGTIIVLAIVIDQTPLHAVLLDAARGRHLPPPLSEQISEIRMPPPQDSGFYQATVAEVASSSVRVYLDLPDGSESASVMQLTIAGDTMPTLAVGERILIRGTHHGDTIVAYDIRPAGDRFSDLPSHRQDGPQ